MDLAVTVVLGSVTAVLATWLAWMRRADALDMLYCRLPGGAHLQTILCFRWPGNRHPAPRGGKQLDVLLPDGDVIVTTADIPRNWDGKTAVVIVHGLCGSQRSHYMVQAASALVAGGIAAFRMNARGCGPGRGRCKLPYHAGRSDDVRAVLAHVRALHPGVELRLLGYSLGGNTVLKLAGELDEAGRESLGLQKVIAVCPSADLLGSSHFFSRSWLNRWLYERMFLRMLRSYCRQFVGVPEFRQLLPPGQSLGKLMPDTMPLKEFDDRFTAPIGGFRDAEDYYRSQSSVAGLVRVPERLNVVVLLSNDDPLIDSSAIMRAEREGKLAPSVRLVVHRHAGHCGFLAIPGTPGGWYWMTEQVVRWLH